MTEPCTRRSTETPGNRRKTVSRWLIRTPNGCGNDGRPPCRHRDCLVTGYAGSRLSPQSNRRVLSRVKEEAFALPPIQARGSELTQHAKFTVATDVKVYFCDPYSPWQR